MAQLLSFAQKFDVIFSIAQKTEKANICLEIFSKNAKIIAKPPEKHDTRGVVTEKAGGSCPVSQAFGAVLTTISPMRQVLCLLTKRPFSSGLIRLIGESEKCAAFYLLFASHAHMLLNKV